jgi:hypothetical protein
VSKAAVIVNMILETGEPDQDYDHAPFDHIVAELAKEGFEGARHREFDKYQGVYIHIPHADRFWVQDWGGGGLILAPEDGAEPDPDDPDAPHRSPEISVPADENGADISDLLYYLERKGYKAEIAARQGLAAGCEFIDAELAKDGKLKRRGRK